MGEEGRVDKRDEGKPPMGLLACIWKEIGDVAKVLAFGNQKYKTIWNFQTIDRGRERMADAALRHLYASLAGELTDPESGLPHMAHAACDVLMALWFEKNQAVASVRTHGTWSAAQDRYIIMRHNGPLSGGVTFQSEEYPMEYGDQESLQILDIESKLRPGCYSRLAAPVCGAV